jgi:hypothetical protein
VRKREKERERERKRKHKQRNVFLNVLARSIKKRRDAESQKRNPRRLGEVQLVWPSN